MQGRWIAISAARARAHRLYGVRGWLIAVLWLNTLPVVAFVIAMAAMLLIGRGVGGGAARTFLALSWLCIPLGLVATAFLRLRWFPVLLFVYGLLQLPAAAYMGFVLMKAPTHAAAGPWLALLLVLQALAPILTMAYVLRSRRVRVTYRHEVRMDDPAAVPAAFDRPDPNRTPTDATDHARERAALRRVAQELSSGVLDTQTWMRVMRHHGEDADSARTAAYVRARMVVLCPPARVHPLRWQTLTSGLGALLVSLVVTGLLVLAVIVLSFRLPGGMIERVGVQIVAALLLCWLGGLFVGARFLRRVAA